MKSQMHMVYFICSHLYEMNSTRGYCYVNRFVGPRGWILGLDLDPNSPRICSMHYYNLQDLLLGPHSS
jgi:hypothetical protein